MVVFTLQAYVLALIGLLISLGGAVFAYLASIGGGFPQLKGWAQKEFKELVFSALIIFLGMFLLHYIVLEITDVLLGFPAGTSTIDNPMYFTQAKIFLKLLELNMQSLSKQAIIWTSTFAGYSEYAVTIPLGGAPVGPGIVFLSFEVIPFPAAGLIAGMFGNIVKSLILTMFAISIMDSLLNFVQVTAFTIFFPLGIVLRAFPITRKLGSTLIALVIAFFFVFPLAILFNQYIYVNMVFGLHTYENDDPDTLQYLKEEMEIGLEETGIEDSAGESPFDPSGPRDIFETISSFNDAISTGLEEVIKDVSGFPIVGNLLGKFIGYIKKLIDLADVLTGLIKTGVTHQLDIIRKWLYLLVKGITGMNIYEFMEHPMRYSVALVSVAMEKFIFVILSFLIDVIICLTLFANISEVLGGETKILGIEKLKLT